MTRTTIRTVGRGASQVITGTVKKFLWFVLGVALAAALLGSLVMGVIIKNV